MLQQRVLPVGLHTAAGGVPCLTLSGVQGDPAVHKPLESCSHSKGSPHEVQQQDVVTVFLKKGMARLKQLHAREGTDQRLMVHSRADQAHGRRVWTWTQARYKCWLLLATAACVKSPASNACADAQAGSCFEGL
jgi:hypothetical protein